MLNDFNKLSPVKYITPVNLRAQVSWLLWRPEKCSSVVMMSVSSCDVFFWSVREEVGGGKLTLNKKMGLIGEKEIRLCNLTWRDETFKPDRINNCTQ